ncbi:hypothetical protein NECAME_16869 [Necator americanus]|uniref:Uncharacterized protein n=1 Tax=Necator americanus TaxID=51031 RepID=W2TU76_NECAM|nr:hypothetical protein NECAME_16869 [Necator americanus]ETN85194.1 hypothetical protein NECAME_16869 [Necator americanus]
MSNKKKYTVPAVRFASLSTTSSDTYQPCKRLIGDISNDFADANAALRKMLAMGNPTYPRRPPAATSEERMFSSRSDFKLNSSPPLASPENDSEFQLDLDPPSKKSSQVASASSGYGSSSGESDQEISEQLSLKETMSESTRSGGVFVGRRERQFVDRWRRRSVPASLRSAFTDDVMRILQKDGHVIRVETDAVSSWIGFSFSFRRTEHLDNVIGAGEVDGDPSREEVKLTSPPKSPIQKSTLRVEGNWELGRRQTVLRPSFSFPFKISIMFLVSVIRQLEEETFLGTNPAHVLCHLLLLFGLRAVRLVALVSQSRRVGYQTSATTSPPPPKLPAGRSFTAAAAVMMDDTGETLNMEIRGARRPESVMQLARRFGEISAAQENDVHRSRNSLMDGKENATAATISQSRSGPCTPVKIGTDLSDMECQGIAGNIPEENAEIILETGLQREIPGKRNQN